MKDKIEVVAFDADDTLWENELYFQEFEHKFCDLLKAYQPSATVSQELFKTEMKNLHMYGYGLKSMMLSMIETACRITDGTENMHCVEEIIKLGQELLQKLLRAVNETADGGVQVVADLLAEQQRSVFEILQLALRGGITLIRFLGQCGVLFPCA